MIWKGLASCLELADLYDTARSVYQSIDHQDLWGSIAKLKSEDLGNVLDLWQFVSI